MLSTSDFDANDSDDEDGLKKKMAICLCCVLF